MARQEHVGRDAVQHVEGPKRLPGVPVKPEGNDLRADPADQQVPGGQHVAGQQHPPPLKQQRSTPWGARAHGPPEVGPSTSSASPSSKVETSLIGALSSSL
jgi:hypothetical protein